MFSTFIVGVFLVNMAQVVNLSVVDGKPVKQETIRVCHDSGLNCKVIKLK